MAAGAGEAKPFLGVSELGCLVGESGEDVGTEHPVSGRVGEPQGLNQVTLRNAVLSAVERHPAGEVGLFGGDFEQGLADGFGVGCL